MAQAERTGLHIDIPTSFAETNQITLHDFIESHSFAAVVSQNEGESVASHLPLLLDRVA
ncbi:MAG: FMN-binding negative transcriptional regulator [Planctomycetota bacterium]|nr:FMN-binding negative transcriptional regulator [Planctomycetota bacterium]